MNKYGAQLLAYFASFFGLPESATETEIHQKTVDNAGLTLDALKAAAIDGAKEAVKADIEGLQGQITALNTELENTKAAHKTDIEGLQAKVTAAEQRATDAETAKAEAEKAVATAQAQVAELSKEVATLKTTTMAAGGNNGDQGLTFIPNGKGGNTAVVKNDALAKYFDDLKKENGKVGI